MIPETSVPESNCFAETSESDFWDGAQLILHQPVVGGNGQAETPQCSHRQRCKDCGGLIWFCYCASPFALGLAAFAPENAAMQAGRVMLARLRQLAESRENFAFETTLASRTFAPWIAELKESGYQFHLVFLTLPSPDLAIERVAERVRMGGHDVPTATIRRRYYAGIRNFFRLYQPLADGWRVYDNTDITPRLIANGSRATVECVTDTAVWSRLKELNNER